MHNSIQFELEKRVDDDDDDDDDGDDDGDNELAHGWRLPRGGERTQRQTEWTEGHRLNYLCLKNDRRKLTSGSILGLRRGRNGGQDVKMMITPMANELSVLQFGNYVYQWK